MANRSSNEDKHEMVSRFLRGARIEKAKNAARARKPKHTPEPDRPGKRRLDDDWDESDWDEYDVPRERARSRRKKTRTQKPIEVDEPNAVVLTLRSGQCDAWLDGEIVEARLPPGIRTTQQQSIAVGDEILVEFDDGGGVVRGIAKRRSSLSRPDPGNEHRQRVLVANVDRAIVVLSVVSPPLKPALIDRMLVALSFGGVEPVLCINKLDLAAGDDAELSRIAACLEPYRRLGIPCIESSAETGDGIRDLHDALRGKTAAFVGHSGVGKSALLNRLDPDHARDVGAGREFDGKGRHTTRGSRLSVLDDAGTRLIDTPGIREFGLWRVDPKTLARHFPDFQPLPRCRFGNCLHADEPDCAVRAAVDDGTLPPSRYKAYVELTARLD